MDGHQKTVSYQESPIMSTYLVEVVIGLFDYVEDHTSDGMVILYVLLTFLPYFMVIPIRKVYVLLTI